MRRLDLGTDDRGAESRRDDRPPARAGRACRGRAPSPRPAAASTDRGSRSPLHTSNQRAVSRTDRARQPSTTVIGAMPVRGPRGMRPAVPFMPTRPLNPRGDADRPAAVAAGGDRDEARRRRRPSRPPTTRPRCGPCCHGLWVMPFSLVTLTLRPPNSLAVVWPTRTAPAACDALHHRRGVVAATGRRTRATPRCRATLRPSRAPSRRWARRRTAATRRPRAAPRARVGVDVRERVEIARVDGRERGLELLERRALTRCGTPRPARRCRPTTVRQSWGGHYRPAYEGAPGAAVGAAVDARDFLGLRTDPQPAPLVPAGHARHLHRAAASCSAAAGSGRPSRRWRARPAARSCGRPRSTCRTPSPRRCSTSTSRSPCEGHHITQARAVGHVVDREILTVNAALGDRDIDAVRASGPRRRTCRGPDDCPARTLRHPGRRVDHDAPRRAPRRRPRLERARRHPRRRSQLAVGADPRRARGVGAARWRSSATTCRSGCRPGARRAWAAATASTTRCASLGSCRPSGCCSTSASTPSRTASVTARCMLWSEDGTLLATASQSTIVRVRRVPRGDPAVRGGRRPDVTTCGGRTGDHIQSLHRIRRLPCSATA